MGGVQEVGVQRRVVGLGAAQKGRKRAVGSMWARRGGGGVNDAKATDIPPPFSSTCFLKRSEKLETARKEHTLYSPRGA